MTPKKRMSIAKSLTNTQHVELKPLCSGDCTDLQMIERIMKRSNSRPKYLLELNFLVHLLQSLLLGVLIVHIIFKHSGVSWFEALGDHLISFYQLEHQFYVQFVYKASLFLHAGFKSWVVAYFIFSFEF